MTNNVVSLFGEPIELPGLPVDGVVRELEVLLEAARAGEIVGFAATFQHRSSEVGYAYAGSARDYAMLGGLDCLRLRLAQRAVDAETR